MTGLTPKQLAVLTFIRQYVARNGYSPNFREIAKAANTKSTGNVQRYVLALEERGYITRLQGHARSIAISAEVAP